MAAVHSSESLSFKHRFYLRLVRGLARLPLPVLQYLGGVLGRCVYRFSKRYRADFDANLRQAYGAEVAVQIRVEACAEAGRAVCELPWLWLHAREEILATIRAVHGWAHVEKAHSVGKGILFLTPHLGCFEITAQYAASQSLTAPMTVLFRQPRQRWIESVLLMGRTRPGMAVAPTDLSGVRRLIKALKSGQSVGLLPDQVPANGQGVWLPWFGKPAYTMTLAARLAQTGAQVIFAYAKRLPAGAGFELYCRPPEAPLPLNDLVETAMAINAELMKLISCNPEQYLWGYNRYKTPRGSTVSLPEKTL